MRKLLLLAALLAMGCAVAYAAVQVYSTKATGSYWNLDRSASFTMESNVVSVSVTRAPNLRATLTANKTNVRKGDTIVFTLVVENTGDEAAADVVVKLQPVAGVTPVEYTIPSIAVGASVTKTWSVVIP